MTRGWVDTESATDVELDPDAPRGELCEVCGQNDLITNNEVRTGVCADCAEVYLQ